MNMSNQTRTLIERLTSADIPQLKGVHATYLVDVADSGTWSLRVDNGHVEIAEDTTEADCTLRANDRDMALLLAGNQNLLTAAMQGRVDVEGSLVLAQRFAGLLGSSAIGIAEPDRGQP
jgi:putative sterol carrier protein